MRPVLFCDFDGSILNSIADPVIRNSDGTRQPYVRRGIRCRVEDFAEEVDADIVICSAWRCELPKGKIEELLGPRLAGRLHDDWRTGGTDRSEHRGDECLKWVEAHGFPKHVIIDDDRDFYSFQPLVRTHPMRGVTDNDIALARWLLEQDHIQAVGGLGYKRGNLLDVEIKLIAHGCNAQGVQGAGFAKVLADRYPRNSKFFRETHAKYLQEGNSHLPLGAVVWHQHKPVKWGERPWFYEPGRVIGNVITQKNYGRDPNVRYVDYDAVREGFSRVAGRAVSKFKTREIGIPMIGAGLGGGDWKVISEILTSIGKEHNVRFTVVVPDMSVYESLTTTEITHAA